MRNFIKEENIKPKPKLSPNQRLRLDAMYKAKRSNIINISDVRS